jgi:hypothetical protein
MEVPGMLMRVYSRGRYPQYIRVFPPDFSLKSSF